MKEAGFLFEGGVLGSHVRGDENTGNDLDFLVGLMVIESPRTESIQVWLKRARSDSHLLVDTSCLISFST